jgi:type IX secretion system PorP/SprF family membrane protein
MKKIFLISSLVCIYFNLSAQQESLRMVYPFLPLAINPADAGAKGVASITGIYRKKPLFQNTGLISSSQQYFSFDMPINKESFGIGFLAFNSDQSYGIPTGGISSNLGLVGILSKDFPLGRDKHVRIGANIGLNQFPIRAGLGSTVMGASWGLGASFNAEDFHFGLSIPTINLANLAWQSSNPMYGNASYLLHLQGDNLLKVGTLVRYISGVLGSQVKTDFNAIFWYKEKIGLGVWYQNTGSELGNEAMLGSVEVPLGNFRVGYAYDFLGKNVNTSISGSSSTLNSDLNSGFHQIFLRYEIDLGNGRIREFRP